MKLIKKLFGYMKVLLLVVWLLTMLIVGAMLFRQNQQLVPVQLFAWRFDQIATGVVISASLLVGVLLGFAAVLPAWWYEKLRSRRLSKRLKNAQTPDQGDLVLKLEN